MFRLLCRVIPRFPWNTYKYGLTMLDGASCFFHIVPIVT